MLKNLRKTRGTFNPYQLCALISPDDNVACFDPICRDRVRAELEETLGANLDVIGRWAEASSAVLERLKATALFEGEHVRCLENGLAWLSIYRDKIVSGAALIGAEQKKEEIRKQLFAALSSD